MKTYIKMTEEFGRGVYAERSITEGEVVEIAEVLLLSEQDTWAVNQTGLKDYTFVVSENLDYTFTDNQDCLVLGNGELYNHSATPNVKYELINLNGRKQMYFTALRDIKPDEQLFIDYNADTKRQVIVGDEKYTTNLL
jgi:SET domain-containing protein